MKKYLSVVLVAATLFAVVHGVTFYEACFSGTECQQGPDVIVTSTYNDYVDVNGITYTQSCDDAGMHLTTCNGSVCTTSLWSLQGCILWPGDGWCYESCDPTPFYVEAPTYTNIYYGSLGCNESNIQESSNYSTCGVNNLDNTGYWQSVYSDNYYYFINCIDPLCAYCDSAPFHSEPIDTCILGLLADGIGFEFAVPNIGYLASVSTPTPQACVSQVCGASEGCCPDSRMGQEVCFDLESYQCIGGIGGQYLCGLGEGVCGTFCFDASLYNCCNNTLQYYGGVANSICQYSWDPIYYP